MTLFLGPALAVSMALAPPMVQRPVLIDNMQPGPERSSTRFQVVTMVALPFAFLWGTAAISAIKATNGESRIIRNMEPKDLTKVAVSLSVAIAIVDLLVKPKPKPEE